MRALRESIGAAIDCWRSWRARRRHDRYLARLRAGKVVSTWPRGHDFREWSDAFMRRRKP
jgi:hypothetical protein